MADDIDIEEHDILDNPVLKRIFPDISIVKKEILKDYEEVPDIKQEEDISITENSINETACFEDKLKISSHVPSTNVEDKSNLDITQNQTQSVTPLLSNKIILGSKPVNTLKDTNKTEAVIRLPRVILQDIKSFLHQNDRFCKDCQIIFSSRLNFDDHRLNVHSITTKNIQGHNIPKIKPNNHKCNVCDICFTSSSSLSEHSKTVHKKQSHICSICKNCFSTLTNLYRHYRNIHKKKFSLKAKLKNKLSTINANTTPHITSRKTKPSGKGTKLEENKISLNVCSHCNKSFPDQKSLIDHIYTVLEPKHHIKSNNKTVISQKKKAYTSTHQMKTKKSNRKVTSHIIAKRNGRQSWSSKLVFENDELDDNITGIMKEMDHEESNEIKASNKEHSTNGAQSKKIGLMLKADEDLDLISVRSTRSKNKRNYKKLEDEIEIKSSLLSKNQEASKIEDDMFLSEPLKKKVRKEKQRPCASSSTKQISKGSKNDITKKNKFTVHFNASINRSKSKTKTNQARNIHDIPYIDSKEITTKIDSHKIKKCGIQGKFVFECIYCSYIVPTARAYYMHVLGKHKIEKVSKVNRVRFNEQCKYCPSKSITVNGHNKHIYTYHDDLYRNMPNECISEDDENDHTQHENIRNPIFEKYKSFVLESVIYKCNRCDIYFLSSFIAKDHTKHMEMLVNWKCKQCARIFKKHDKQLHLKQHNFSKTLSVCQFNESELSALLYSCTKCAIHFTEDRYIEHYSNCDKETTDSVYCKACDILIDKPGYNNHEVHHKNGKKNFDFTIIVADIIADINKQENGSQKKKEKTI